MRVKSFSGSQNSGLCIAESQMYLKLNDPVLQKSID